MNILITNDDGVNAEGIRLLASWARKLGDVTVVAPKHEQSGKSHAIDFVTPLEIKKVPFIEGCEAYSVSSTPADCVRFAVLTLGKKFDLVLSGLNCGVNLGADLVYSGTCGAIFEAARMHIPAVAFSTFPDTMQEAAEHFDRVFAYIEENALLEECPLYNVNIPKTPEDIRMTYQGSPYFSDRFIHKEGDIYVQEGEPIPDVEPNDCHRDTVALHKGYITVTPLLSTRTDMRVFEKFKTNV